MERIENIMNALFVHSSVFKVRNNIVYSDQFPYNTWERYLNHFDSLSIVARHIDINQKETRFFSVSSGNNVDFLWTYDLNKISTLIQNIRHARRILRENMIQSDAVIIRLSEIGWIAAEEAERMGKPWVVEVVGDHWGALWNYGTLKGKLAAPIAMIRARKWIAKAPFAIYVTDHTLQGKYPCRGITAGISDVEIQPIPDSVLEKKILDISKHKTCLKIGLIGSMKTKYKGIFTAIKAINSIKNQINGIEFHILGDGDISPYRNLAEKIFLDECIFFDGIRPSGMPVIQWLDNIDLYIQPSFTEGLPRALTEAMSRACPALGSTAGGIPELLPADCLHNPGDEKHLAALLKKAICDRDWRIEQAKRNFEVAKKYYSDVLNKRRNQFWVRFSEYAQQHRSKAR